MTFWHLNLHELLETESLNLVYEELSLNTAKQRMILGEGEIIEISHLAVSTRIFLGTPRTPMGLYANLLVISKIIPNPIMQ
jgi:hypothetical protein